jgi:hypothetical protein
MRGHVVSFTHRRLYRMYIRMNQEQPREVITGGGAQTAGCRAGSGARGSDLPGVDRSVVVELGQCCQGVARCSGEQHPDGDDRRGCRPRPGRGRATASFAAAPVIQGIFRRETILVLIDSRVIQLIAVGVLRGHPPSSFEVGRYAS